MVYVSYITIAYLSVLSVPGVVFFFYVTVKKFKFYDFRLLGLTGVPLKLLF
jgi:hypothetical protein